LDASAADVGFLVFADGARRAAAGTHGQDHGGAAGDDVAAGKHARQAGGLGGLVGHDVAPLVELLRPGVDWPTIGLALVPSA
jgi:hypothetical protein